MKTHFDAAAGREFYISKRKDAVHASVKNKMRQWQQRQHWPVRPLVTVVAVIYVATLGRVAGDQAPSTGYGRGGGNGLPANYAFTWKVKDDYTKNDYGQTENREGEQTQGEYHVLLPDGRTQRVSYTVDAYNGRTSKRV